MANNGDDRDEEKKPLPLVVPPDFYAGRTAVPGRGITPIRAELPPPPDVTAAPPSEMIQPVERRPAPPYESSAWLEQRAAEHEAAEKKWNEPPTSRIGKILRPLRNIGYYAGLATVPSIVATVPGNPLHEQMALGSIQRALPEVRREEAMEKEAGERTDIERRRLEMEGWKAGQPKPTGKKIYGPNGEEMNEYEYQTPQGPVMGYVAPGESPTGEGAPPPAQIPGVQQPAAAPAPTARAGEAGQIPSIIPAQQPAPPMGAPAPVARRAGTPPPGYSTNQLTAEQRLDQQLRDISQKPEAQRTPEENRLYAANYPANESKLPMTADMRMGYMKQIAAALNKTDLNPESYTLPVNATGADAKEILAAAQKAGNEYRMRVAPEQAQRRKDEREPVYVEDKNHQTILSNRAQAEDNKLPLEPVDKNRVGRDRVSIAQIGDVQANESRYTLAGRNYSDAQRNGTLSSAQIGLDQANLHELLNKAGLFNLKLSGVLELDLPLLSPVMEAMSRQARSSAYNELSLQAKDLYDGYLRVLASVPGYQKMLFETGRNNKEMLDLELANIPDPSLSAPNILRKLRGFQENIDRATARLPANLPGMESSWPPNIRKHIEGEAAKYPPGQEQMEKPPAGAKIRKFDEKSRTWSNQ